MEGYGKTSKDRKLNGLSSRYESKYTKPTQQNSSSSRFSSQNKPIKRKATDNLIPDYVTAKKPKRITTLISSKKIINDDSDEDLPIIELKDITLKKAAEKIEEKPSIKTDATSFINKKKENLKKILRFKLVDPKNYKQIKEVQYTDLLNKEKITTIDIIEKLGQISSDFQLILLNKQGLVIKLIQIAENLKKLLIEHIDNEISLVFYKMDFDMIDKSTENIFILHIMDSLPENQINYLFQNDQKYNYPLIYTEESTSLSLIRANIYSKLSFIGLSFENKKKSNIILK
jgi:hypothetical protein